MANGRKRLHDGVRGIIRSGHAPVAMTNATHVAHRRGKEDDANGSSYYHVGLDEHVFGETDLKAKMAAQDCSPRG